MIEIIHPAKVLDFCARDPVRYRHIAHELASPCPEWDQAMARCDYAEGPGFVLRDAAPPDERGPRMRCFADSPGDVELLACVRGRSLRVEGRVKDDDGLAEWCRQLAPTGLETSDEAVRGCLDTALGGCDWREGGGQYSATRETFRPRRQAVVRRLRPEDRPMWRRFVDRHAHDPIVNARGGSQAVVRDFEFMCMGLPVDCYATCEGGEMTGMLSVNPFTDQCDEIATVFVDPAHRRKGLATSLLSAATEDILSRDRLPAYSAAGSPSARPDLHGMVTGIGYSLVCVPWEA